jgi:drug/metabolite transporter (DMT)-like permease
MATSRLGTIGRTVVALCGFAANSLLCRKALGAGQIDAASFTALRLAAGAVALLALASATSAKASKSAKSVRSAGSFVSALSLFLYAIAFSIAYLRIGAGVGALVLFGAVQTTMIGWGLLRGERPSKLEWIGVLVAIGGLAALTLRGAQAPDLEGVALMAAAGAAWGVYSLRGRRAGAPLLSTAGNFLLAAPLGLGAVVAWLALASLHVSLAGAMLAVISGAVTSGLCYAVWYSVLPRLSATRAAIVQLSVPALTALGAVLFLNESVTARLLGSGLAILGGVAMAVLGRRTAVQRSGARS